MSDAPTAPKRNWTLPLLFAVPMLGLLVWVYTALQFSRPPVSFLRQELKIGNGYYEIHKGSLLSPITEVSGWTWQMSPEDSKKHSLDEITHLGFVNRSPIESLYSFHHPKGESLFFVFTPEKDAGKPQNRIEVQYARMETRPLYCLVKRLKYFYDEKVSPPRNIRL